MNEWAMWAEKSTHSPTEMMRFVLATRSMVKPQAYMAPATST